MLVIDENIWYESHAHSPAFPQEQVGIHYELLPANSANGPTLAMFASMVASSSLLKRYGGRVTGAIKIIAINPDTGDIFHASAEPEESVPMDIVTRPQPNQTDSNPGPQPTSMKLHFNVDIGAHLSLPSAEQKYTFFIWLDEYVSDNKSATVPANPNRTAGAKNKAFDRGIISFDENQALADANTLKLTSTQLAPTAEETWQRTTQISGNIPGTLLSSVTTGKDTQQGFYFLRQCYQSRDMRANFVPINDSCTGGSSCQFTSYLPLLADCGAEPQKIFMLLYSGKTYSDVLTITPPL